MAVSELSTVKVPAPFSEIFINAEKYVSGYFGAFRQDPQRGVIEISGERYILVRSSSMAVQFFDFIKNMYPGLDQEETLEASAKVLYDMAHAIGRSDARSFHEKTGVKDPIAKLSTGPVHFAFTGWAFVEIFPESKPSPDESFYLLYDHPQSFEADSWLKDVGRTAHCTCFMNSGYSSGWCSESFGINLVARELLCRAKGDQFCRFIMCQPHRMEEFTQKYRRENPELFP